MLAAMTRHRKASMYTEVLKSLGDNFHMRENSFTTKLFSYIVVFIQTRLSAAWTEMQQSFWFH